MRKILITGADHPTGLGTARAVHRPDLYLMGIYSQKSSPCTKSNMWQELIEAPMDGKHWLSFFTGIAEGSKEKVILLPCQDQGVKFVSDFRDTLDRHYDFLLPDKDVVDLLLDKALFQNWAEKHHLPVPLTQFAENKPDLINAIDEISCPLIVKPNVKTDLWEKKFGLDKTFVLKGQRDIDKISCDLFKMCPQLIAQQYIPGDDSQVYFCLELFDSDSREIGYFTGKKILQWPPLKGSTAIAVAERNETIHNMTREIFETLRLKGLGSIEYKKNPLDGKYYIIEPTVGRNDLQSNLSLAAGVNLSLMAVEDITRRKIQYKRSVNNGSYKKSIWLEENGAIDAIRASEVDAVKVLKEVNHKKSINVNFAYFHPSDPLPFLHMMKNKVMKKYQRR
jgi:predicted ATP-grasp superfamily ATP-dependent carboligase